jgi:hypothetical protein
MPRSPDYHQSSGTQESIRLFTQPDLLAGHEFTGQLCTGIYKYIYVEAPECKLTQKQVGKTTLYYYK